jgi:outer membrane protein assembly complex protein YaeT
VLIVLLRLAANARAQTNEVEEEQAVGTAAQNLASGGITGVFEEVVVENDEAEIGLAALGGGISLGGVATCRGTDTIGEPVVGTIKLTGELLDDEAALREVLDGVLGKERRWNDDTCSRTRALLDLLRYDVALHATPTDPTTLTVGVAPRTMVRRIRVTGNWYQIYEDEVRRRLRIRPGTALEGDPQLRDAQYAEDELRVREFLSREGFFEAVVRLIPKKTAPHEVALTVALDKGPSYRLGEVRVRGNTAVRDEVILEKISRRWLLGILPARFSYDRLEQNLEEIRVMYQKEYGYPAVRVTSSYDPAASPDRRTKTVRLEIRIEEGKRLDVAFVGNKHKSNESLRSVLTFDPERATDDYEAEQSAEAIRKAYQEDGRWETVVNVEERFRSPQNPQFEQVIFQVDEGPRRRVERIDFSGNKTFDAATLRSKIVTTEYPRGTFEFLVSGGYVTTTQLAQDRGALIAFYQDQGFRQVEVEPVIALSTVGLDALGAIAAQVTARQDAPGLFLRFRIAEGPRDVVQRVEFVGNEVFTDAQLLAKLKLRPGVPFSSKQFRADAETLKTLYADAGYTTQTATAQRTGGGAATVVTYEIEEGERTKFGRTLVRGNFKTKTWVIRDVLSWRQGRVATGPRISQGQTRLRESDLFASVRIQPIPERGVRHQLVEVEERYDNLAEGELSFGYSTDNNLFVAGNIAFNNLGGIGPTVSVNGELGLEIIRVVGTVTIPQFLTRKLIGIGYQVDLSARYRQEETERFGTLRTAGFGLAASRRFPNGVTFSLRYDWNRFGRTRELVRPAGPSQGIDRAPVSTTTASIGPTLVWDKRTPAGGISPTGGFFVSASAALASRYLLGTDDFLRFSAIGQVIVPLADKRIIIKNSLRYDHGVPLGGSLLPEVERFAAGGDTTIRGYEQDRAFTEVITNPLPPLGGALAYEVIPSSGNIRAIHNLDVEFRLFDFLGFPIASALFLDTGTVLNSYDGFGWSDIKQALGIALIRWVLPGAAISVEWALPLKPTLGDDPTGRVHWTIGVAF